MVQRAIYAVEDAALARVEVVVCAPGPNEPFHPVEADVRGSPKEEVVKIRQIEIHRHMALAKLGEAFRCLSTKLRRTQRRKQQRRQNCDNGDYDEKLDECEGPTAAARRVHVAPGCRQQLVHGGLTWNATVNST